MFQMFHEMFHVILYAQMGCFSLWF